MLRKLRTTAYSFVKKIPVLRRNLPLKINKLDSFYDVVYKNGIHFCILREAWDMRELLVYEEFVEQSFVLKQVTPSRFLDIGSHIGTWTMFYTQRNVDVLAVDANRELLVCIGATLKLNSRNATLLNYLIGPPNANLKFLRGQNSLTGAAVNGDNSDGDLIEMSSLETLIDRYSPDFIKTDIEGLDIDCFLATPVNSLKRLSYAVLEVGLGDARVSKLTTHLRLAGLQPVGFFDLKRRFIAIDKVDGLDVCGNLHFVKIKR